MSLIGQRFGRWIVVSDAPRYFPPNGKGGNGRIRYNCLCDCGKEKQVREDVLLTDMSKSCGCIAADKAKERRTHGLSEHPLYSVLMGIRNRCFDTNRKDYKHYGGRGITICNRWNDPIAGPGAFIEDMGETYKQGLEIERIDVNGNYEPSNCCWVTHRMQVINRRPFGSNFDTKYITHNGVTLCLSQWADRSGVPNKILKDRLGKLKWEMEKAISYPVRARQVGVILCGTELTLDDIFNHPPNAYPRATKLGMPVYAMLAKFLGKRGKVRILSARNWYDVPFENEDWNLIPLNILKPEFMDLLNSYGVQT